MNADVKEIAIALIQYTECHSDEIGEVAWSIWDVLKEGESESAAHKRKEERLLRAKALKASRNRLLAEIEERKRNHDASDGCQ